MTKIFLVWDGTLEDELGKFIIADMAFGEVPVYDTLDDALLASDDDDIIVEVQVLKTYTTYGSRKQKLLKDYSPKTPTTKKKKGVK